MGSSNSRGQKHSAQSKGQSQLRKSSISYSVHSAEGSTSRGSTSLNSTPKNPNLQSPKIEGKIIYPHTAGTGQKPNTQIRPCMLVQVDFEGFEAIPRITDSGRCGQVPFLDSPSNSTILRRRRKRETPSIDIDRGRDLCS